MARCPAARPAASGRRARTSGRPQDAAAPATPAEVERAIEATAARYVADFAGLYDRIAAEVGRLYAGQLAAKDETIAELRRRAEAAEAERDALRRRARAGAPTLALPIPAQVMARVRRRGSTPAPLAAATVLWARLGRWWRG